MTKSGLGHATRQFFMTTTLHGFKYLCSGFHSDRVCWVSWCVASACCAGTLCAVLWARFLEVPALLTVRSATSAPAPLPAVAVCLPPASAAFLLVGHLSADDAVIRRLTSTFSNILQNKETKPENLMLLDTLLKSHNVTILDALYRNMPPCREFAKKCRWQKKEIPCGKLFHRELTMYGVCCVIKSSKLKRPKSPMATLDSNKTFRMVLRCSKPKVFFGCEFFIMYEGEETVNTVTLVPGSEYTAQLTFTSVQDSDSEKLVTGSCVSSDSYSRKMCMDTCMERHCGCSNPLRTIFDDEYNVPPPCKLWQLGCLQRTENSSCNCLPSCRKISTALSLENNIMKSAEFTFDPIYQGINVSSETVIKLRVLEGGSKIFTRQPTETWFTLLSSLGGVFNMFLGVGLFSALELVFFVLVRVPAAVRTAPEMHLPVAHVQARH
ncbi:uncharacterized protein LOC133517404 [Cydia pomonella]|uniref:uncharacterized protein LOC133517404 n=1 Tax=Cydia pomonella TaxID=82600 RepID=UPI002ADDD11C|nr:uncharacterized protein LOC133517404 [Cydia pomonella]